jgi:hypothetical protein
MAVRISTGLRNHILDVDDVETPFASGSLKIFTGAQPADADQAETGTLIADITLPATPFGAAASGVMAKSGTWEDTSADNAGDMGWGRFMESGDGGGLSTVQKRIDFNITITAGGGELTFPSITVGAGDPVTIDTFTITMPAN